MTDQVQDIPLAKIVRNPDQPRQNFPEDHIAGLAKSIAEKGLLQPILVRPLEDAKHLWIGRLHIHRGLRQKIR